MGQIPSIHRLMYGYNNQYKSSIDSNQESNGISLFPLVKMTMFIKGSH